VPAILFVYFDDKLKDKWIPIVSILVMFLVVYYINNKPNFNARVLEAKSRWINKDFSVQTEKANLALTDAKTNEEKAIAYYWMGVSANRQRDFNKAIEYQTKAIELDPSYGAPYSSLSLAYSMVGKLDEAKINADLCVKYMRNYAWCYYSMGVYLEKTGDIDGAIKMFEKACKLAPDDNDLKIVLREAKSYYNR
jgi:tetratricopeptide (TPR) repeat protein